MARMRFVAMFLVLMAVPLLVRGDPPDAKATQLANKRERLKDYEILYSITTDPVLRSEIAARIKELSPKPESAPKPQPALSPEKQNAYEFLKASGLLGLIYGKNSPPAAPQPLTEEERRKREAWLLATLLQAPPEPAPSGPRTDSREYERSKNNY
jgi:hypothetical protein